MVLFRKSDAPFNQRAMKKSILQGVIFIAAFLLLWFVLSMVRWTELFRIRGNWKLQDNTYQSWTGYEKRQYWSV